MLSLSMAYIYSPAGDLTVQFGRAIKKDSIIINIAKFRLKQRLFRITEITSTLQHGKEMWNSCTSDLPNTCAWKRQE